MIDEPKDADARRAVKSVICYPVDTLPTPNLQLYQTARADATLVDEVLVSPRNAAAIKVPARQFLRMQSVDGPQAGDLNLFAAANLSERFYSDKTRTLHGTHITTGDRMWSCFPYLRPMATIVTDMLNW